MDEVRVKTDDWRALAQALTGSDAWTYGPIRQGYQDYTHGIPQTRWERRTFTLGGHEVTEVSFYALRMVGNGHMLETLRSMEVELRVPEVVQIAKIEGRQGLHVASGRADVRRRLEGWNPVTSLGVRIGARKPWSLRGFGVKPAPRRPRARPTPWPGR